MQPSDFPGLLLWLRADVGVVTSGSGVITWTDQSGNNNHYAQGNPALQPTHVSNAWKNKPGVRFVGGPKSLVGGGLGPLSQVTLVVAARADHAPSSGEYFEVMDDFSPGGGFRLGLTSAPAFNGAYFGASTKLVRAPLVQVDAAFHVAVVSWNGSDPAVTTSYELTFDGVNHSIQMPGATYMTQTTSAIGMLATGAAFFQGDLFEIAVYGSALSASDRATLSNLVTKDWSN